MTVPELRRYQRTPIDLAVTFSPKDSTSSPFEGRATDISLGGMFIATATPLPFGSELAVYIAFPRQRAPLGLAAVVRWTRRDGMGIQFRLLGARETHGITDLVLGVQRDM